MKTSLFCQHTAQMHRVKRKVLRKTELCSPHAKIAHVTVFKIFIDILDTRIEKFIKNPE